jgi:hypothetical protein
MTQKNLLTLATALECLAGLALILAPRSMSALLLGAGLEGAGLLIGRIGGFGLLALGIACWGARTDPGGTARSGTLRAITLYNTCAGLLLVVFAATGEANGIAVWAAGALHLGLALAFLATLRRVELSPPCLP